jgi:hypothetical protein
MKLGVFQTLSSNLTLRAGYSPLDAQVTRRVPPRRARLTGRRGPMPTVPPGRRREAWVISVAHAERTPCQFTAESAPPHQRLRNRRWLQAIGAAMVAPCVASASGDLWGLVRTS